MPFKDKNTPEAQASIKESSRKYYLSHKEEYKKRATASKEKLRAEIRVLKAGPCTDCGKKYPFYVMQFDHISDDKEFNISSAAGQTMSLDRIKAEIEKCELVCANCHAERTYSRYGLE